MGRLSWIIQGGSKCNHVYPHKKEAEGDLTQIGKSNMKTEHRIEDNGLEVT